jgi:hypothetical protein
METNYKHLLFQKVTQFGTKRKGQDLSLPLPHYPNAPTTFSTSFNISPDCTNFFIAL